MARPDHKASTVSFVRQISQGGAHSTPLPPRDTEDGLSAEVWYRILSFLPWDQVSNLRLVSRLWYVLCCDIRRNVGYHAARCLRESDAQSPHALWSYFLESQRNGVLNPEEITNTYLRVNFPKMNGLHIGALSDSYQETKDHIFHADYSIRNRILVPNAMGRRPYPSSPKVQRRKAEGHVSALFKKWEAQLLPGQLLERADVLVQKAAVLKAQYPQAVALLARPKEGRVLPEKLDRDEATAYRELQCFLEESAAYEEVLLELAAFANMVTNLPSGPNYRHGVADLFIFTPEFPLSHRLSKAFYLHYMPYICLKMSTHKHHYILALSRPQLMEHLFAEDDALLLQALEYLWDELPEILEANPALYQRMSPDLWIQLCEETGNYTPVILKDPRIYCAFSSQELLKILSEHPLAIFNLYRKHPEIVSAILKQLEAQDLVLLRFCDVFQLSKNQDIYTLAHTVLCEKFKVMETEELKNLQADFPEPSWGNSDETVKQSLAEELSPRLLEEKKRAEKLSLERWERLSSKIRSMLNPEPLPKSESRKPIKTSDRFVRENPPPHPSTLLSGSLFSGSISAPSLRPNQNLTNEQTGSLLLEKKMETLAKEFHRFRLEDTAARYSGCSAPLVRWFKSKKTNASRQQQLQLLRDYSKESDVAVKVGALVKISKKIGSETNVFRSSMKSRVDAMIRSHLNRTLGSTNSPIAFNQEKAKCLAAFEKHDANRHLPHIEYTF